MPKSGYVAIIGRSNVGKSTLLNGLLGKKLSITSPKPQTTRWQILGIKTQGTTQTIYMDTPGLHSIEKQAMNRYMNRVAQTVILDAHVIIFVIDAMCWTKEDERVLKKLSSVTVPVILVINKLDQLANKTLLLPLISRLSHQYAFAHVIPISALKADNICLLEEKVNALLPESPHDFPDDQVTDKSLRFQVAEMIREKLMKVMEAEVPYVTAVDIEQWQQTEKMIEMSAVIWVARKGQRAIVVGHKGHHLKEIGIQARREIEALLGCQVYLRLWVKVKKNWTNSDQGLRSLGYE